MKYTSKMLDTMCDNLNASLGLPTLAASWETRVAARAYLIEKSYGGYMLAQYASDGGGIRTMHSSRATARECADIIRAFGAGTERVG